jgi:hypothetical protein
MISKTALRMMLSYLEIDSVGIDAVYRIVKEISHEEAVSTIWTLLALLFPEVGAHAGRAAWEAWLQDGIAGQPIAGAFDTIPDFGAGGDR